MGIFRFHSSSAVDEDDIDEDIGPDIEPEPESEPVSLASVLNAVDDYDGYDEQY